MALIWESPATVPGAKIEIHSDGWSGEVIRRRPMGVTPMEFQFDIHHTARIEDRDYDAALDTAPDNHGFVPSGNDAIIGISLEHFGIYNDGSENILQVLGLKTNSGHYGDEMPAYGGNDTELNIYYSNVMISHYFVTSSVTGEEEEVIVPHNIYLETSNNTGVTRIRYEYVQGDYNTVIKTDLPIFATDADLLEFIQSDGTELSKLLNAPASPEEKYEDARNYHYIRNIYGHNADNPTEYTGYRNYRFYGENDKICFYVQQPTESHPFTVRLYNYQASDIYQADIYGYGDEDYTPLESQVPVDYLHKSIQFSDNNWYKCFQWDTDLLIFGSLAEAEMWKNDLIDARQALNFDKVSKAYNEIIDPEYGNPDPGYDNGYNGQSYVNGARMWVMTSTELNNFFDDIFDPNMIDQLLEGTKLFGSQEIQAIQGISYFPIDIDEVANVYGSAHPIKIGNFTCPTATGRYVISNNKLIDCGSVFIKPVYNDFRDYHMKLFIQLPYVGTHELNISKFLHHNLEVFYAVDISTGGCTAHVLADGISYGDSYDGFMASQRPLTALDQTSYLNSVMGCVSTMVDRQSGLINSAANAIAGAATGNPSGGGGGFHGPQAAFNGIKDTFALQQAIKDYPMSSRGGFAGCLGFFGNQQIHIITVQSKTVKPSLEQQLVGYPSHVSQRIGNFSGYLRCSAVNLNNFPGTAQELADIHNLLANGIYLN